jgi:hypothetical protein
MDEHEEGCQGVCEFCGPDSDVIPVYSHRTGADRHYCRSCGNPVCF